MDFYDEVPKEFNYAILLDWERKAHPNAGVGPSVANCIEESAPFKLNWVKVYILCGMRSGWFRGVNARLDKMDHFALGKKAMTFREVWRIGVEWLKNGAQGLTDDEKKVLADEYASACSFARGENPDAKQPVEPPKTIPKPSPDWWTCEHCGSRDNPPLGEWCLRCHTARPGLGDENPAPSPDLKWPEWPELPKNEAGKGEKNLDWKKITKVIGGVASTILMLGIFIRFIPGLNTFWPYIETVLKVIEKLFNG